MKHIKDLEYKGHEIIILQHLDTKLYAVDVRADNFDGEIIAGYEGFVIAYDAKRMAQAFIDGRLSK
jgi:hypothetical protein